MSSQASNTEPPNQPRKHHTMNQQRGFETNPARAYGAPALLLLIDILGSCDRQVLPRTVDKRCPLPLTEPGGIAAGQGYPLFFRRLLWDPVEPREFAKTEGFSVGTRGSDALMLGGGPVGSW